MFIKKLHTTEDNSKSPTCKSLSLLYREVGVADQQKQIIKPLSPKGQKGSKAFSWTNDVLTNDNKQKNKFTMRHIMVLPLFAVIALSVGLFFNIDSSEITPHNILKLEDEVLMGAMENNQEELAYALNAIVVGE